MNEKIELIRRLIERTQDDFTSYYATTSHEELARLIVAKALNLDHALVSLEERLDRMLPDTEDDGQWQASFALNTGCMLLSLIDAMKGNASSAYEESAMLFFDTIDLKVQELLEEAGVDQPSEEQIADHPLMQKERLWFLELVSGA